MAVGHGLAPLLPQEICNGTPAGFSDAIGRACRFTLAANVAQMAAASEARDLLAEKGMGALLLKGAALLEEGLYRPGQRPMSDIDLLVRRGDLESARAALLGAGWTDDPVASWQWALAHHHNWRLLRPGVRPGLTLELHWTPTRGERVLPTFEELRPIEAGSGRLALPPSSQLYFLCTNTARHGVAGRLLFLVDVARLARARMGGDDWERLHSLASGTKTQRAVRLVLQLASNWLDSPLPAWAGPPDLTERLLASALDWGILPGGIWRRRLLRVLLADSLAERTRIARRSLARAWQRPQIGL